MKLYLDANVIIYAYEAEESFRAVVLDRIRTWCLENDGDLVTSQFSRLECRVVPLREGDDHLLAAYDDFFRGDGVELVEVSLSLIDVATALRARYGFKSPDAIHLASAIQAGAATFLTADDALRKCSQVAVELIQPPAH